MVKDFDPLTVMDKKEMRRTDRYCQFAVAAAKEAMEDCGSDLKDLDPYRVGVIVGSGIGGLHSWEDEHNNFIEKGPRRVSVFFIPMMITNMAAGVLDQPLSHEEVMEVSNRVKGGFRKFLSEVVRRI